MMKFDLLGARQWLFGVLVPREDVGLRVNY